ncbi:MAG: amidohydrolase [Oscillospiraceae bacterium]
MLFRDIAIADQNFAAQTHMNILTKGNRIVYIGKDPVLDYSGPVYDGKNKIAMPGFFNVHCHASMTLLRGYGEGLPLHRWLTERMFPFEALLTPEDIYWGATLGIAEMIRSGAVSFTDMYMEMDGMCRAVEESGIRANLSHGCSSTPETRFTDVNGYKGLQYLMDYTKSCGHDRIIGDASIHAEYTSSDALVEDIAAFAKQNGLRMHLHLSETKKEHDEAKQRRGGLTAGQWFEQRGVFEVPVTAAHCVWIEDADISILARNGATAVHCPSSNLKLGSGIAPLKCFLDAGVRVAIGTDGAASNNNLNCLEEVNLASLLQKGSSMDPLFMGTAQTLQLACQNGAYSQGRADCGSLKEGNRADIVVYDLDKPHMQPVFEPIANVLYAAQADDIVLTMIDGKEVYRDGEFKTIDIEKTKHHAAQIAQNKLRILNA